MNMTPRRAARAAASLAMVFGIVACGGGEDDASDPASASALETERATVLARRPPPPPPAPDATLALASASASGQASLGGLCGLSADGSKVAFVSPSANLVSGDANGLTDLFLKNFNGNGITRVVVGTTINGVSCLALTPDANTVVFVADTPTGVVNVLGFSGSEAAIMVKNLGTGQQTRVTPPLSTFANVDKYEFAGVSDDGLRVAFLAQPTRSCSGYDCTANGPARMLLRDVATGALVNLESQVRFTTSQGVARGNAWLSPDGRTLAFSSNAAYPEAGFNSLSGGVFAFDIASGAVRLVSTDSNGVPATPPGTFGTSFGVQGFLANSGKIVFRAGADTSVGAAGVFVKDLAAGALTRILGPSVGNLVGERADLSFSDDGRKVAYVQSSGNTLTGGSVARVLDLQTGATLNAATLSNGTAGNGRTVVSALLSRDGRVASFSNNSTNLVAGASTAEVRVYRKLLP